MDVKAKVLQVMRTRAAHEEKVLGGRYTFSMATLNLRLAMESAFPEEEWTCAELRKVLTEMAMEGLVSKDAYRSRIGQASWKLEVRDA